VAEASSSDQTVVTSSGKWVDDMGEGNVLAGSNRYPGKRWAIVAVFSQDFGDRAV